MFAFVAKSICGDQFYIITSIDSMMNFIIVYCLKKIQKLRNFTIFMTRLRLLKLKVTNVLIWIPSSWQIGREIKNRININEILSTILTTVR